MQSRAGSLPVLMAGASLVLAGGCTGMQKLPSANLVADIDWSGLEPVDIKGVDIAYVSPAASLAGYSSVMLDPIEVSFAGQWQPSTPGSPFAVAESDLERLRQDIAGALQDSFIYYMDRDHRYPVVTEVSPGALRIRARVVDVMVNAPDFPSVSRSEQYAFSFGEVTLVAELIDAESGALVGRLIDRWVDPKGPLERYTRVENRLALQRAMRSWTDALQGYLNVASFNQRIHGARDHDRANAPP